VEGNSRNRKEEMNLQKIEESEVTVLEPAQEMK
jgi:hypothetical protein